MDEYDLRSYGCQAITVTRTYSFTRDCIGDSSVLHFMSSAVLNHFALRRPFSMSATPTQATSPRLLGVPGVPTRMATTQPGCERDHRPSPADSLQNERRWGRGNCDWHSDF